MELATGVRRAARGLVLTGLLLGPLAVAERFMWGSLDELAPEIGAPQMWGDTKSLIFRAQPCPEVLALGSSMSDRIFREQTIRGERLDGPVDSLYNFALYGSRASTNYMIWRHVQSLNCTPRYLLIEVNPLQFNGLRGTIHEPSFLDLVTLMKMPEGYIEEFGRDVKELAEITTWERLILHRRRAEALQVVLSSIGVTSPSELGKPLNKDGGLSPLLSIEMSKEEYRELRQRRRADVEAGIFDYQFSPVLVESVEMMIRDAKAAGCRVILHVPPTTDIYRNILAEFDVMDDWCALAERWSNDPAIEFYDEFGAPFTERTEFTDHIHLNAMGAKAYVKRLFKAIRSKKYRQPTECN